MNFLAIVSLFCLLVPVWSARPLFALQVQGNLDQLIRQSTFIFVGTVEKLNASTMTAVKPNDSSAVVRIDRLIDAPGAPPDLAGKSITVQLLQPGSLRPGQQTTFFTKGWLLGNSMAVIEVGHILEAQSVQEQVGAVHQQMADEKLQSEIATAAAVVSGRVRAVHPAKIGHMASEHDPDWYQAEIAVGTTLKGNVGRDTVTVLFPNSDDVVWHNSPKFKEGQQGIWLLHRNQARLPGIEDQYTALRALDFQQQSQLERVQRLMKNTQ
jgi:hypothetical protein